MENGGMELLIGMARGLILAAAWDWWTSRDL